MKAKLYIGITWRRIRLGKCADETSDSKRRVKNDSYWNDFYWNHVVPKLYHNIFWRTIHLKNFLEDPFRSTYTKTNNPMARVAVPMWSSYRFKAFRDVLEPYKKDSILGPGRTVQLWDIAPGSHFLIQISSNLRSRELSQELDLLLRNF